MRARFFRISRWITITIVLAFIAGMGIRAAISLRGPQLEPWHKFIPQELSREAMDHTDWLGYLEAEDAIFETMRREITPLLTAPERVPANRYFEGSPSYPGHFAHDWNRSFVLEPDGPVRGAAVFLHGLTDAPYSLRHIAQRYRELGYVAIGIRMPGHGTVPGGLTAVEWEDWLAATRLAVREARRRVGPALPLHLVGYSNGGALAVKYALDAMNDPKLTRADRIVLISPMIGISPLARFAGLADWPAIIPVFEKTKWLSVLPEFNPFKYNSFPVNAARQSHRLTTALKQQISDVVSQNHLTDFPPILAFQSVVDFTVSTRAVIASLFDQLPMNGSELVLFDINHAAKANALFRLASETELSRLLPPPPRRYRTTIVTNASDISQDVVARVTEPGATDEQIHDLTTTYPIEVYSLSHVALPFPVSDGLYGLRPDPADNFGISLGSRSTRGEVGVLLIDLDSLMRMSSNPFFPFMMGRIEESIAP